MGDLGRTVLRTIKEADPSIQALKAAQGHEGEGHKGWRMEGGRPGTLLCECGATIKLPDPPPTACCPVDGEPLMSTFEYVKYEFCCLVCGRLYGFLSPQGKPTTPELDARHDELRARWDAGERPKETVHGRG